MTAAAWSRYMKRYNATRRRKLRRRHLCIDCGKNARRIVPGARRKPVLCESCCESRRQREKNRIPVAL